MKRCDRNNYDFFAPIKGSSGYPEFCCEYHAHKYCEYVNNKKQKKISKNDKAFIMNTTLDDK